MTATANLHLVLKNFIWRLENYCTPLIRSDILFRYVDPFVDDRPQNTGGFRKFTVLALGSGEMGDLTSGVGDCITTIRYRVSVGYPIVLGSYTEIIEFMSKDRLAIIKTLREQSYRIGYDSTNFSTDIGLYNRYKTSDEISNNDENNNVETMLLILDFNCLVYETEY